MSTPTATIQVRQFPTLLGGNPAALKDWAANWQISRALVIFLLVMLQMTAALRPWIGTADTFLPTEKKFFVSHWLDCIKQSNDSGPSEKNSASR